MALSFLFGTVGSPTGTPKKPGGSVGAIQFSQSIGLYALELGWVQSVRVTEATCAAIQATGAEQGVALSVHAPYFINLNATDEEWPKSRKRLMDAAHYGNLAGATDIIFHPGSYFGAEPAEVLKVDWERCVVERGDSRRQLPWNNGQFGSNTNFTMSRTNFVAATDALNNQLLLQKLQGVAQRSARYVCVIALVKQGAVLATFRRHGFERAAVVGQVAAQSGAAPRLVVG